MESRFRYNRMSDALDVSFEGPHPAAPLRLFPKPFSRAKHPEQKILNKQDLMKRKTIPLLAAAALIPLLDISPSLDAATMLHNEGFTANNQALPGHPNFASDISEAGANWDVSEGAWGVVGTPKIRLFWNGEGGADSGTGFDTFASRNTIQFEGPNAKGGSEDFYIHFIPDLNAGVNIVDFNFLVSNTELYDVDWWIRPVVVGDDEEVDLAATPLASGNFGILGTGATTTANHTETVDFEGELGQAVVLHIRNNDAGDNKHSTFHFNFLNFDQIINPDAAPPVLVEAPAGPASGLTLQEETFSFVANDPNDEDYEILVDWGDGSITGWHGPVASGSPVILQQTYVDEGLYLIRARARNFSGDVSDWVDIQVIDVELDPDALPEVVEAPAGPTSTSALKSESYTFTATDPLGGTVEIEVDWGDGSFSGYSAPVAGGTPVPFEKTYVLPGTFTIFARARSASEGVSDWVEIQTVDVGAAQLLDPVLINFWATGTTGNEMTLAQAQALLGDDVTLISRQVNPGGTKAWTGPGGISGSVANADWWQSGMLDALGQPWASIAAFNATGGLQVNMNLSDYLNATGAGSYRVTIYYGAHNVSGAEVLQDESSQIVTVADGDVTVTDFASELSETLSNRWRGLGTTHTFSGANLTISIPQQSGAQGGISAILVDIPMSENSPSVVDVPAGPSLLGLLEEGSFSFSAIDPSDEQVEIRVDWGDGRISDWLGPVDSGDPVNVQQSYPVEGVYTIRARARNASGSLSAWQVLQTIEIEFDPNVLPEIVVSPAGPVSTATMQTETYTFTGTDPSGEVVEIEVDWGDGSFSGFSTPVASGTPVQFEKAYAVVGSYTIFARVRNASGAVSDWVEIQTVTVNEGPLALAGLWEFADPGDLGKATFGDDLVFNGSVSAVEGIDMEDPAMDLPAASWIAVTNPIGPNGSSGSPTRTNRYAIVMDFKVPVFQGTGDGAFSALFDFDGGGSDADYFIRKQANQPELGVATVWNYVGSGPESTGDGTTGTVLADTWYRLILTADNGVAGESAVFLNGVRIGTHATGSIDQLRRSIGEILRVGWDNDGEDSDMVISMLALFNGTFGDIEAALLGSAGDPVDVAFPLNLIWTATESGEWTEGEVGGDMNWALVADGTPSEFIPFSDVRFDETADRFEVIVDAGGARAGTMTFDSFGEDYTLGGGPVSGVGGLIKLGEETLTLTGANTFTGETVVDEGLLVVAHPLALQGSTVSPVFPFATISFDELTAVTFGGLGGDGDIVLENEVAAPVELAVGGNNQSTTFGGQLSGQGSLLKTGSGALTLGFDNIHTGGIEIADGALSINGGNNLGPGDLTVSRSSTGAFLTVTGGFAAIGNDIAFGDVDARLDLFNNGGSETDFSGTLNGGGDDFALRLTTATAGDSTTIHRFSGSAGTLAGRVQIWRGVIELADGGALGNALIDLSGNNAAAGDLRFAGSMTVTNDLEVLFASSIGVGNDTDTVILSGTVGGTASLRKVGPGTLVLTGETTTTGNVLVQEGSLVLVDDALLASVPLLNMSAGATLDISAVEGSFDLSGVLRGTGEVVGSLNASGSIEPGPAANTIGELAVSGGLTMDGGGLVFDYDSRDEQSDTLVLGGGITLGGTVNLQIGDLAAGDDEKEVLADGTKLVLIEYNGSIDGLFFVNGSPNVAEGATLEIDGNTFLFSYDDTNLASNGTRFVTLTADEGATPPAGGFDQWALDAGLDGSPGLENGLFDDPDGSGRPNLVEFFLAGNPLDPADNGMLASQVMDVDGVGDALVLSFAAPAGTDFSGGSQATIHGLSCEVQGSRDLEAFAEAVVEITPALVPAGWPTEAPDGWQYHSFRLDDPAGVQEAGFLRLSFDEEPSQ